MPPAGVRLGKRLCGLLSGRSYPGDRNTTAAEQVLSASTAAHPGLLRPLRPGLRAQPRHLLRFHGPGDPPARRLNAFRPGPAGRGGDRSRGPVWPAQDYSNGRTLGRYRLIGAGQVLDWLLTHPGDGWQARRRAADADCGKDWIEQVLDRTDNGHSYQARRSALLSGLNSMFISRIVLPDYEFMRGYKAMALFKDVQRMFPPGTLEQMRRHGSELGMTGRHVEEGLRVISKMILHTGRDVDQLTPEDVFEARAWGRRAIGYSYDGTHSAWDLMRGAGVIHSKDTLKDALRHGQRPTAELVDFYNLQSTPVRNLLVRYLEERRPGVDYGTFVGWPVSWLACSGLTSRPTTPASTASACPTKSSTGGSSGCSPTSTRAVRPWSVAPATTS